MILNPCIEVQTSAVDRPSVPAWFAEVVSIAQYLAGKELLDAFADEIRLVRGRFGSYEPIDFLALLLGYAISGERTLADFFERLAPFGSAFMALFGRRYLPHRSSLSRFLADVDRPSLEAFRTLFEQDSFARCMDERCHRWQSSIGRVAGTSSLISMPHARQEGLEACPLIQPYLPLDADWMRSVRQATPGENEGRSSAPARSLCRCIAVNGLAPMLVEAMATSLCELSLALRSITTYLRRFALTPELALVRLDGQYGDTVAMAQLLEAGMYFVTRARGYHVLEQTRDPRRVG